MAESRSSQLPKPDGAFPTPRRPRLPNQLRKDALRQWTRALVAHPSPARILERILRGLCRLLREDAAAVWEIDEDGKLRRVASYGLSREYIEAVPNLAASEGVTGIAALTRRPVTVTNVSTDARVRAAQLLEKEGIRAFASVPLIARHGATGNLNVYRRHPHSFTRDELDVVTGFADVVGAALENAHLREKTAVAVAEFAAERATLASIVQNAADGIVLIDDQWRVLLLNPASERLIGWRAQEVVGQPCSQFLRCHHCGDEALCEKACPMLPIFNLGSAGVPYTELLVNTRDGGERWVGVSWSAAKGGPSGRSTAVMVLRDITAAKEVDQMKSAIIGLVSHELRTPLTSIRMLSELLLEHPFDSTEGKGVLRDIAVESQRLGQLVDSILEVARIEGGQVPLHLEPVPLQPLVAAAVALLSAQSAIHTFQVDVPEDFPRLRTDPERLRQILDNLLGNAVKYSPTGGIVTIRAVAAAVEAYVSVTDEGLGIAPEELTHLFEPFRRIGSPDVARVPGTGLGLHIARSLLERQGGRIWAESTPGEGSTFTFALPLADRFPIVLAPLERAP